MIPLEVLPLIEVVLLGFILNGPKFTLGYANGAPAKICDTMLPRHGTPEKGLTPYTIIVSQSSITPNGTLSITIVGDEYSGLMLQARHPETLKPVGVFSDFPGGTKPMKCFIPADTMTHSSTMDKGNRDVYTWTAPPNIDQDIRFVATIAVGMFRWWVNVQSNLITLKLPTTTTSTTTTTTATTTTQTTTIQTTTTPTEAASKTTGIAMTSPKSRAFSAMNFDMNFDIVMNDEELQVNQTENFDDEIQDGDFSDWDSVPIDFSTRGADASIASTTSASTTQKAEKIEKHSSSNESVSRSSYASGLLRTLVWGMFITAIFSF